MRPSSSKSSFVSRTSGCGRRGELPIRPDYVGKNLPTKVGERVQVELLEIDEVDRVVLTTESADE